MKAAENPFRSSEIAKLRYRIPEEQLRYLAGKAASFRFRQCSLIGPEGSGKTTLLEDMEVPLRELGLRTFWIRLQEDMSRTALAAELESLDRPGAGSVCLFDGAEVLSWWRWLRVRRQAGRRGLHLIATLHRRRGLPVLRYLRTDWPMALKLVKTLAGPYMTTGLEEVATRAFVENRGNLREVFAACYRSLGYGTDVLSPGSYYGCGIPVT